MAIVAPPVRYWWHGENEPVSQRQKHRVPSSRSWWSPALRGESRMAMTAASDPVVAVDGAVRIARARYLEHLGVDGAVLVRIECVAAARGDDLRARPDP